MGIFLKLKFERKLMKKSPNLSTNQQQATKVKKTETDDHKLVGQDNHGNAEIADSVNNVNPTDELDNDLSNGKESLEVSDQVVDVPLKIVENGNEIDSLEDSARGIVELLEKWRQAFAAVGKTESEVLEQLELVKESAIQVRQEREEDLAKMQCKAKQLANCLQN